MKILVINSGSSSLKYQLIDPAEHRTLQSGQCEKIGSDNAIVTVKAAGEKINYETAIANHQEAVELALKHLTHAEHGVIEDASHVDAVGHRVVHGGHYFATAAIVTDDIKSKIESLIPMAPLHNGPALVGIEALEKILPGTPQAILPDTAFHQSIPIENHLYAIPWKYYREGNIRKYGFHGTSHHYVTLETAKFLGKNVEETNLISCHLGNGGSITVVKDGKSFDTSMGFTPLDGIVMGTRSGSIDPAVVTYIMRNYDLNTDEMDAVLNKESGFLGISDVSNDFRELVQEIDENGANAERAKTAIKMYAQSIRRYIGTYLLEVPDVECIVCTAGIGENSAYLRSLVFENLGHLGIILDEKRNSSMPEDDEPYLISSDSSRIKLLVVHTDEEFMIAQSTAELLE